jgi:capsular polysaccharide biosynthesis protein/LysM repeat protein
VELRIYLQILWKKWWIILAACLSTVIAVSLFTFNQTPSYRAAATYVVTPVGQYEDAKGAADALDMLSRRTEIATTYAEVANSRFIKQQAADELGLSSAQRRGLSIDSRLLLGTNILEIKVEGSNPQLVQVFTDMVGFKTATYVQDLYEAYSLKPLDTASLPTSPVGPSKMLNLAFGGILGLGLGMGLAFLAYYLETPVEPADRQVMPAGGLASVAEGRRESGEVLAQAPERMVLAATSRRPGASSRRRMVGWIVAATVALVLIAGGLAAWLSGRETSAASPPEVTPIAGLIATVSWTGTATIAPTDIWTSTTTISPTDVWTSTTTISPTGTALPTAMPTIAATSEPSPARCSFPSGWLVYAVQEGDTLSSLALSYGVSEAEIIEANCLPGDDISQSRVLLLPPQPGTLASAPTPTSSATVSAIPTASRTPTSTPTPSPTQTNTPSPTPRPSRPSPTPTKPAVTSTLLTAPKLSAPLDQQEFQENDDIVLVWEPVGNVPGDSYYAITVSYTHLGARWYDDVPWTHGTTWTLSEHSYLLDLSDDGQFQWSVQVVRPTGLDANGRPVGEPLSALSEVRMLTWRRASSGGGQAPPGGPTKPPLPPP